MKAVVTDFEGNYKAYAVSAAQGAGAPVLTTAEAQTIFGDASAKSVVGEGNVSGRAALLESGVHLITLSLTFNEVIRMAAALAKKNGGAKLCDVPDGCGDGLTEAFSACAAEHGLTPLNKFFVTSRSLLRASSPDTLPETDKGMSDGCMEKPDQTVGCFDDAGKILKDMQVMLLFNEGDFPGHALGNRYYVSGLYAGAATEANLPVRPQNETPLGMVMAELRRTMK